MELGRAYNNLYWSNPYEEEQAQVYLELALEAFLSVEEQLWDDPQWQYCIGYTYYCLCDVANAKEHLKWAVSGNSLEEMRHCIEIAEREGIPLCSV